MGRMTITRPFKAPAFTPEGLHSAYAKYVLQFFMPSFQKTKKSSHSVTRIYINKFDHKSNDLLLLQGMKPFADESPVKPGPV